MATDSRISEDQWKTWLRPLDAIGLLLGAGLVDHEQAVAWISNELYVGRLKAAAYYAERDEQGNVTEYYPAIVSSKEWARIDHVHWKDNFWVSGDYRQSAEYKRYINSLIERKRFQIFDEIGPDLEWFLDDRGMRQLAPPYLGFELVGTRFAPAPIIAFCEAGQAKQEIPHSGSQAKHGGGRPPKPFWDQLWASMAARLYNGTLIPQRQADIERAMNEWVTQNDEKAGETAVRAKAKLLWTALQTDVEN